VAALLRCRSSVCYTVAVQHLLVAPPAPAGHGAAHAPQEVVLGADGTVWLPALQTLCVADVHIGKARTFRAHGLAVPDDTRVEAGRLFAGAVARGARRLVVLGDFVHGAAALADDVVAAFGAARAAVPGACAVELVVVRGNHERALELGPLGARVVAAPHALDPAGALVAVHAPASHPGAVVLAGHLHPGVSFRQGIGRLRARCFVWDPDTGVLLLPAFAAFASGTQPPLGPRARVFALATANHGGSRVVEVTALLAAR
jgi:DNA ligase-associated metallophosphoesterase